MIRTRIVTTAALVAFGLASFGGVAIAAPAQADTVTTVDGTHMTGTAGQAVEDAREVPDEIEAATRGTNVSSVPAPGSAATQEHVAFPLNPAPHSEHNGQGKKGSNDMPHPHH
ncbi:hypothetical protein ACFQWH_11500 [Mycolicibacterium sp. GCM10028919]|uniref:hypothetical protein n=1 Tax=Mycolicibacterium sp. GCM10028919 TaxID=3273401 RepID=UPI003615C429